MKGSLGGGIESGDYKESHPDRKGRCARRIDATWQKGYASRLLAPVAQLDRVLPSKGRGRAFESRRARQFSRSPIGFSPLSLKGLNFARQKKTSRWRSISSVTTWPVP